MTAQFCAHSGCAIGRLCLPPPAPGVAPPPVWHIANGGDRAFGPRPTSSSPAPASTSCPGPPHGRPGVVHPDLIDGQDAGARVPRGRRGVCFGIRPPGRCWPRGSGRPRVLSRTRIVGTDSFSRRPRGRRIPARPDGRTRGVRDDASPPGGATSAVGGRLREAAALASAGSWEFDLRTGDRWAEGMPTFFGVRRGQQPEPRRHGCRVHVVDRGHGDPGRPAGRPGSRAPLRGRPLGTRGPVVAIRGTN